VAGILCAISLAACSSAPQVRRDSDRLAAYTAAAGAPVRSFRFFSPLYSWQALSDSQLAIYTKPREAYLLDLQACHDLQVTNSIALTSRLNQVEVGFDRVINGRLHLPCVISQIRPVDVSHLKAVEQAQRKIEEDPRPAAASQ
jgi:hypothetical protein